MAKNVEGNLQGGEPQVEGEAVIPGGEEKKEEGEKKEEEKGGEKKEGDKEGEKKDGKWV
jgi:hypothetical protein